MSDSVHVNSSNSGSGSTNLTSVAPSSGSGPKLSTSLKIAILLNSYRSPFISEIRESYVRSIGAVAPDSILTFFYPAEHIPVSTTSSTTFTSTFTSTGSVVGPGSGPGPGLGLGLGLGTIHGGNGGHGGYGGHGYGHAPPPVHVHGSETGGHREHHRGGHEYEYRFNDLPDPSSFDLIVIGGGNADPRKTHGWILRVHRFIRDVVANYPSTKLCGICWGHQTISLLFGGEIVDMGMPEVSFPFFFFPPNISRHVPLHQTALLRLRTFPGIQLFDHPALWSPFSLRRRREVYLSCDPRTQERKSYSKRKRTKR